MIGSLIGLNALAVAVFLVWIGWHLLMGLSRAFGSASPRPSPDVFWVFLVAGLASLGCVVASFLVPPAAARKVALAPILLVVLGQGLIFGLEAALRARHRRQDEARSRFGEAKLREWPRDFVKQGEDNDGYELSFLIRDLDLKALVRIDVFGRSETKASCVGLIDGEYLDVDGYMEEKYFVPIYKRFVDREGKGVLDHYRLRPKPGLELLFFPLEKYRFRP